MKKRLIMAAIVMAVSLITVLAGCSKEADVDVNALAEALRTEITYKDDIAQVDIETAKMFISFGDADITEAVLYEGTGGTAEEIIVVKCGSAAGAESVEKVLNSRVAEQKESFADYVPAELEKLNAAVVVRSGNCAVLSVSDEPDKARDIIKSFTK